MQDVRRTTTQKRPPPQCISRDTGAADRLNVTKKNLTWTEEGLEYEGRDKHRRALLEGLGLNEDSKAVNSAEVYEAP